MLLDFYLLAATFFHRRMHAALAESWRCRSFTPCRDLCAEVLARSGQSPPVDCMLRRVILGLPFASEFWHAVVGEILLLGCDEIPLLQTAPATLCCLLAPDRHRIGESLRSGFAPIEQVHFGNRDLRFGGAFYRPEHAGYNDEDDVFRLQRYLESIDPGRWTEAMLREMPEFSTAEEREEELAFVRDWWQPLVEVYRDAARRGCVLVCERT
jgi:hypothetical protein